MHEIITTLKGNNITGIPSEKEIDFIVYITDIKRKNTLANLEN